MKDQWTELPKLSKERGYHGICGIGSHVYIAGGYSCVNSETLNSGRNFLNILQYTDLEFQ